MKQKTAIIIGASTGIGAAAAIALAKEYKKIAITSFRHPKKLETVRQLVLAQGADCYAETGDAGDFAFIKRFIGHVTEHFGEEIDLLVNNAGISYIGLLTDMEEADWQRIMDTNITSVFNACRQVVPHMVHAHKGRIINVSSVWGNVCASCELAYSATKGAVNAFTKALAKELAPSGIAVNAIAFGAIDTTMNGHLSSEEKMTLEEEIPFGRMGTETEAADFIVTVANAGSYLTGQILTFDGGWQ